MKWRQCIETDIVQESGRKYEVLKRETKKLVDKDCERFRCLEKASNVAGSFEDSLVVGDHKCIVKTICPIVISPPSLNLAL